jgi:hypothetical protein
MELGIPLIKAYLRTSSLKQKLESSFGKETSSASLPSAPRTAETTPKVDENSSVSLRILITLLNVNFPSLEVKPLLYYASMVAGNH